MTSVEKQILKTHLDSLHLDVRSSGNGRWIDQKVTPDVLSFISDCVLNLPSEISEPGFSKNDVWHSTYFGKNVVLFFGKPNALNSGAKSEYDKFCSQPLKVLSYAGLLKETKHGRQNTYTIENVQLLSYVSLSESNAFRFLSLYIEEVLGQSGFWPHMETFFKNPQSTASFLQLRDKFRAFTIGNTPINTKTEVGRIFPKVLNVLSCERGALGVQRGALSKYQINFSDLSYNGVNFRDKGRNKRFTRKEAAQVPQGIKFDAYEIRKVMNAVRARHYPISELQDKWANGEATQVHHIFPQSKFPTLRKQRENLILLTATQHNSKAHPSNNTREVDANYQIDCLVAKVKTLEASDPEDPFYTREGLINVLQVGLGVEFSELANWDEIVSTLQDFRP